MLELNVEGSCVHKTGNGKELLYPYKLNYNENKFESYYLKTGLIAAIDSYHEPLFR